MITLVPFILLESALESTLIVYYFQGFVAAVNHMREFVPAIYDLTFAFPKDSPPPTMLRLLKGQPSVVSCDPWTVELIEAVC